MESPTKSRDTEKTQPVPGFLLEKLWQVYSATDDRRRRGFYYLVYSMALFAILWIKQSETFELPILKTQVTLFDALIIAPAFILILTVRYLYLCFHTLRSFVKYLQHFRNLYAKDLEAIGYSFGDLYSALRLKDLTENLNVYLFPIKPFMAFELASAHRKLYGIVVHLTNVAIALTVLIPLLSYFLIVVWLSLNYAFFTSTVLGLMGLGIYVLLGILFVLSPIYFYYRGKHTRTTLKQEVWPE